MLGDGWMDGWELKVPITIHISNTNVFQMFSFFICKKTRSIVEKHAYEG